MIFLVNELRVCRQLFWLGTITLFLVSCDTYNFSQPQPSDKENMYSFPDDFTGRWEELPYETDINFSVPVNSQKSLKQYKEKEFLLTQYRNAADETGHYIITKNYVSFIHSEKERVVAGAWPKLDKEKQFVYPPGYAIKCNVLKTVNYDSLKRPLDTIDHYLLKKNKIYEMTSNHFLYKGHSYYMDRDTIVVLKNDTTLIDLGQNAFLRQLNNNLYAFNIKKGLLGEGQEDEGWWMLVLLERKGKDSLIQWECSSRAGELDCMFYDRSSKSDYFYFECNWNAAEILRLKKEGYFKVASILRRMK